MLTYRLTHFSRGIGNYISIFIFNSIQRLSDDKILNCQPNLDLQNCVRFSFSTYLDLLLPIAKVEIPIKDYRHFFIRHLANSKSSVETLVKNGNTDYVTIFFSFLYGNEKHNKKVLCNLFTNSGNKEKHRKSDNFKNTLF